MMHVVKSALILLLLLLGAVSKSYGDEDYQYFFKPLNGKLALEDQKKIYELMELQRDSAANGFVLWECPPTDFDVELKDINHDGVMEVFVHGGNTCTSGSAGRRLWLFVKTGKSSRAYKKNLGVPVGEYELLTTEHRGYPDIQLGGPGFCFGLWRWNGEHYDHFRNVPTAKNSCPFHQ